MQTNFNESRHKRLDKQPPVNNKLLVGLGICALVMLFFSNYRASAKKLPPASQSHRVIKSNPLPRRLGFLTLRRASSCDDLQDFLNKVRQNLKLETSNEASEAQNSSPVNDDMDVDHDTNSVLATSDVPEDREDEIMEEVEEEEDDDEDDDEEKDDDEDDQEEDDDDEFPEIWVPFLAIPDSSFVKLLDRLFNIDHENDTAHYEVENRKQGAYHHVVILTNGLHKVVVKIPMVGTLDRWKPGHAKILRSEAHTMIYIKYKLPNFPIPDVYSYDEGFENELGAPFTVMSFVDGVPAHHIWFDENEAGEDDPSTENSPSEERENIRITFLRSLAQSMAELRKLEFDGIGMLFLEDGDPNKPYIGPTHGWDPRSVDNITRFYWERPVFKSAAESYNARVNQKFELHYNNRVTGTNKILSHVFNSPPFSSSKKHKDDELETFTLQHNDFDYQNILVSETGEIQGIIDWDECVTVPRCVGFSTVPLFLQADHKPDYDMLDPKVLSPWNLAKYRKIYSDAMSEACGGLDTDAKYTEKSAIYAVAHDVLFGDNSATDPLAEDFIEKLLRAIPLLRHTDDSRKFTKKIGAGWEQAETVLKEGILKVLDYHQST